MIYKKLYSYSTEERIATQRRIIKVRKLVSKKIALH